MSGRSEIGKWREKWQETNQSNESQIKQWKAFSERGAWMGIMWGVVGYPRSQTLGDIPSWVPDLRCNNFHLIFITFSGLSGQPFPACFSPGCSPSFAFCIRPKGEKPVWPAGRFVLGRPLEPGYLSFPKSLYISFSLPIGLCIS